MKRGATIFCPTAWQVGWSFDLSEYKPQWIDSAGKNCFLYVAIDKHEWPFGLLQTIDVFDTYTATKANGSIQAPLKLTESYGLCCMLLAYSSMSYLCCTYISFAGARYTLLSGSQVILPLIAVCPSPTVLQTKQPRTT